MSTSEERPLFKLERKLQCNWENLRRVDSATFDAKKDLFELLNTAVPRFSSEDANLVVFGSFARKEWIDYESDLDWTYFVDGQAKAANLEIAQEIKKALPQRFRMVGGVPRYRFGPPGQTGTFGNLGFSHQLVHAIGGQDDTNKNMTQRILLLLESDPVGTRSAYDRIARAVIDRYIDEESQLLKEEAKSFKIPRFLLNDVVRFWRTMAVDFAGKQRDRGGHEWGLRNAKLRMSRKLIFVSGMLLCFSCNLDESLRSKIATEAHAINVKHMANHVWRYVNLPPLDIVASTVEMVGLADSASKSIFSAYDQFIAIMSDTEKREQLKQVAAKDSRRDKVFGEIREISRQFEEGLKLLFFDNQYLKPLTQKYGVF